MIDIIVELKFIWNITNMSTTNSRDFIYERSLDFVKAVRRRYFSRQMRRPCMVFLPIGIIGFLGIILPSTKAGSKNGFWLLIFISVVPYLLLIIHRWAINQIQMKGTTSNVAVHLESDTLTIRAEKSSVTIEWSKIKTMWKFTDLVLLFWDKKNDLDHAFAIPTAVAGKEVMQFIEDKVKSGGGRII